MDSSGIEEPISDRKINTEQVAEAAAAADYFTSYEDCEVHKLMLEDHPRLFAYKRAIENNASYIKGKVVMDVGSGTGVLAVLCAQAGAKKVYAVEATALASVARDIVKENKCEDIVEVLESRVEDVTLPEGEKVDLIVSEWMGFYLLHEGMLDSVLEARDKFLKSDGHMFPESATIYAAPCSIPTLYKNWENVHGVSMRTFGKLLRQSKSSRPDVLQVQPEDLLGQEEALCWINLKEDQVEDLNSYSLKHVVGVSTAGAYQGICVWFDCLFPELTGGSEPPVQLSTSPLALPTHWKQTVVVLPEERHLEVGEPIAFQLDVKRSQSNRRRYDLQVTLLDPSEVEHPLPCSCHMTKCIVIAQFMQQHPEKDQAQVQDVNMRDEGEYDSGSDSD